MAERKSPARKTFGFGGCNFGKTSPEISDLTSKTRDLNITIPFEDALKLNLAIDECIRELNSFNRARREGKRTALNLRLQLAARRITVNVTSRQ